MTKTISSQHYLNDDLVAAKLAARDFSVLVSPTFSFCGQDVRVILDGHHSLAAAKQAGVEPDYRVATEQDSDHVALINKGDYETFLEACWMDGDWYDVETGGEVW